MTTEAERIYQRDWMRRHRAAHPPTAEQLAEWATRRRDSRRKRPDHDASLTRSRRAADPDRYRQQEHKRWADPDRAGWAVGRTAGDRAVSGADE